MNEIIYFVEDDTSINELIKETLQLNGFDAHAFLEGKSFLTALNTVKPDLILLDIMLPNISGLELIKILKSADDTKDIPIIILSALSSEQDVVKGLDMGAVDYIAKPFRVMEFISRINANLRERKKSNTDKTFVFGDIVADTSTMTCTVEGKDVQLTLKEFELLTALMARAGKIVTRAELLRSIWGFNDIVETRTLDMHIKSLREKFSKVSQKQYIVTVRSVGHILTLGE